jgi:hypothetical protein
MKDACRAFTEKLDALLAGSLPEAEIGALRAHAAACPDCAALLALQRRLAGVDAAALEAAVPEVLLDGMWPRVSEALLDADARQRSARAAWSWLAPARRPWLAPALAAAAIVLALATGFLAAELRRVEDGQRLLARELSRQERALAALQQPAAGGLLAAPAARWQAAGADGALSVGALRARLAALPPGTVLLDAAEADRLRRALPAGPGALLPAALGGRAAEGSLRAGEALRLLGSLDPDTEIPPERVAALAERLRGRHHAGPRGW